MKVHLVTGVIGAFLLASMAEAQQSQSQSGDTPPVWVNNGNGVTYDNNNPTPGDGPVLGSGYDANKGDYMTWTYKDKQYRVLKSACNAEQWAVWKGLDGKHIELTMTDGIVQDVHEDV